VEDLSPRGGPSAADSLEPLFRPRSVAIIGASGDFSKTAGKPAAYLKKHGFAGRLFLVNPRYAEIDGVRCYSSVAELPEAPDVGLVLLGPGGALQAVRELAQQGARTAIVLSGGYAEIDSQGVARQAELCDAAGEMRLLGPNTIGMVNLADHTALSASVALELDDLPVGGVSVVSQSGGMLGALLSRAAAHGLGLSKLIATGNEADVDVCDAIGYLLEDDQTRVIALYVESVRRPQQFRAWRQRRRIATNRWWCSRLVDPRPVRNRLPRTLALWPAPTGCTTRCFVRPARSASTR
jgi:acetate---CoA ligase (ADP-forming)